MSDKFSIQDRHLIIKELSAIKKMIDIELLPASAAQAESGGAVGCV